ncbi:MAP7 domain-containing protein 2 isoform X13 [Gouania willdenowi]|uniref:MAP7 domain-containing protein 2 isoform X13 n=1 Tax=Gouania willdenowi TaxID=441366 RepID=UPI0010549284|nr:MAP7 domain-containing protein 2-like isoform X13 [Gouania willdenowi]
MAEGAATLKGLRAQIATAAQAQAEERRNLAGNSPGPASNTAAKPQGCRPVIDGAALRIDDRLRVAKERREEADRQQALRDSQIMERERKAKLQVERQVEERQKKVEEQRKKEEQKRLAVEEKRKLKQEEEKEHYEAVMRRTLERSHRVEQRQKRWSWGGQSPDSDARTEFFSPTGDSDATASSPVTIVISPASPEKPPRSQQVDKRSTSILNLKQPPEASISKRLSSSSATLIKSPEKSLKPARSSSCNRLPSNGNAANASKEDGKKPQVEKTECNLCPRSASASPLNPPRGPVRSRSIDRQKNGMTTSVSADGALDPSLKDKALASPGGRRTSAPSTPPARNRSPSPAPIPSPKRAPSPGATKQSQKMRPPSPGAMKQRPPSPQTSSAKAPPTQKPSLTPTGPPTLRKRDSKSKDLCPVQALAPQSSDTSKSKDKDESKSSPGTNSASEAAKILAENRRLMREQKEKEEQLRVQKEEEEKLRKEEEKRLAEEAKLKRQEEEKILAEERKIKEEEDARLAEEERVKQAEEDALKQAELQREREEADAKALEEAERVRQERDRIMQQNQQERMERKKRIEEIMKRTRKGDGDLRRDDDKQDNDNDDEGMDQINCDPIPNMDNADECELFASEPVAQEEEPLGNVDEKSEMDNKENDNSTSTDESQAVSPILKGRLVEGSEFLNEDSAKVGLVSSLNGKSNQWSFEELIDVNVHSKTRPLIEADGCNQVLINCDGSSDGSRVTFEEKGIPIDSLHPIQPIESLSEI